MQNEGLLVGYFVGAHEVQWRGSAPKQPARVVRMLFLAMVQLDQQHLISHLWANCDREHAFEQCQVLNNTFSKIEFETVALEDRVAERSDADEVISAEQQQANIAAAEQQLKVRATLNRDTALRGRDATATPSKISRSQSLMSSALLWCSLFV